MAFSNDKVWTFTRDNIIEAALRKVGEYDEGDSPTAAELTTATFAFNAMVREWIADGIGLWLRQRCILIINPDKWRYRIGPIGTTGTDDDFHAFADTELIENTIKTDEAAAETTISIEDDNWLDYAGNSVAKIELANSDNIGIMQDDGTIHWDTIADAAPGTDIIDITTGLDSAASAGNRVYTYTSRIARPHGIVHANRENSSGSSASIEIIGRRDYELLSLKSSSGPPTKLHFDPTLAAGAADPATNYATFHVWPVDPGTTWMKLVFVGEFYPDEITTAAINPQFPDEWANALIWGLANELADEYEIDLRRIVRIDRMAKEKYNNLAWAADREEASFFMARENDGRY